MGPQTKKFFRHVGIVAIASLLGSAVSFGGTILAGRILGPEQYGMVNVILAVGSFLVLFMAMGFPHALMHYLAKGEDPRKISSTAFSAVICLALGVSIAFLLLVPLIAPIIRVAPFLLVLGISYGVIMVLANFFQSLFQGLALFSRVALFNFSASVFFVGILFFSLFAANIHTFESLFGAHLLRWVVPVGIAAVFMRAYLFPPRFDLQRAKTLMGFGVWAFLGIVPGYFLGYVDKVMLNYFLGAGWVGIYSAYMLSSALVLERGAGALLAVFFPYSSGVDDKLSLFRKMNTLVRYLGVPVIIFLYLTIAATIFLFGSAYEFNHVFALAFSVSGFLSLWGNVSLWFIFSMGGSALRFMSLQVWISMAINVLLNFFFIPMMGVLGAAVATIAGFGYLILMANYYVYRKGAKKT